MPTFAAFMVLFALANAGLPGTSGFVGEFMVIIASFKANFWFAFLAASTLILGAAYTLWMVKRVIYGEVANKNVAELLDLNRREFLVLGILAISVLLVGLWPAPLVDMMSVTVQGLLEHVSQPDLCCAHCRSVRERRESFDDVLANHCFSCRNCMVGPG
jgi:NADH-quinone oxidoreductase subunit M